ncbi:MAG: tRNA pseudouridine(38-40) synthase TruA [Clostridia bacterium]|nr:tRNA pseudouridine(38-40) synthase TruA [Clostridia bacterium]
MAQKLLLYIRYDGSHFCGYQAQKNGYSVQQALNEGTEALFGYPCDITGCSRTDSGVHANMFCATITPKGQDSMETSIPLDRLPLALNIHLPDAVAAYKALWVPADFHARYSVSSKEYVYRILNTQDRNPFEHNRAWHYPRPITDEAFAAMQTAAKGFIGKRDFAACMASGSKVQSTVRHVMAASMEHTPVGEGNLITFRVRADGFLYNMVRIMVGTLAEVAEGHIPADSIPERLASLDRSGFGRTAPAEGLYLNRVFYNDPEKEGYHAEKESH